MARSSGLADVLADSIWKSRSQSRPAEAARANPSAIAAALTMPIMFCTSLAVWPAPMPPKW